MKMRSIFLGAVLTCSGAEAFAQDATQSQKIIAIQQAKITSLENSLSKLSGTVLTLQKSFEELSANLEQSKQNTDAAFLKKSDADARYVTTDNFLARLNQCRIRIGRNNGSWGPYNTSESADVSTVPWTGDQNIVYDFRCDYQWIFDPGSIHVFPGIHDAIRRRIN